MVGITIAVPLSQKRIRGAFDSFTGQFYTCNNEDALGGYTEQAARIQFLYEGDDFTGLFNYHVRASCIAKF